MIMERLSKILSVLALLPLAQAQAESCISLATSTTCSAFNGSSISTDAFLVGLYPFLRGVTDTASFDRNLTAYVYDGYVNEKYETLFGCSGINLDNSTMTSNLYARFTTTVICNGVVQNSISRCNLSASESHPVCADTCAQYALSEQKIVADTDLCINPSNYTNTQLRADYTNCGLPENALTNGVCIEGISNEPTNCGFGYATIGLCQYCNVDGENPSDPCCSKAQASTRCANVILPSITVSSSAFLTATSTSSSSSNTSTPTSSNTSGTNTAGALGLSSSNSHDLSGGAIAGIVVGGVVGLVLLALLAILLACCCVRRRKRVAAASASRKNEKTPARDSVLAYNPHDSSVSSLGRPQSEYEVLPGGRAVRKTALSSEYSMPPFAVLRPSTVSEYGETYSPSTSQKPQHFSPKKSVDGFPGGFFSNFRRSESVADSDFMVLPGGRRARVSTSIAPSSRPVSPPEEYGPKFSSQQNHQQFTQSASQSTMSAPHTRQPSQAGTVVPEMPPPENEDSVNPGTSRAASGSDAHLSDHYEVLPGGRIARKSAMTGHVGGEGILNEFPNPLSSVTSPAEKTLTAPQATKDMKAPEPTLAAPIVLKGPTIPPTSSIKDYYSPAQITAGHTVTAVWSYAARTRDEFVLERGDVIHVTSLWGDGWGIGFIVKGASEPSSVGSELSGSGQSKDEPATTNTGTAGKEVKAFPLVCVCDSEYWDRVIEAGGKPLSAANFDLI